MEKLSKLPVGDSMLTMHQNRLFQRNKLSQKMLALNANIFQYSFFSRQMFFHQHLKSTRPQENIKTQLILI